MPLATYLGMPLTSQNASFYWKYCVFRYTSYALNIIAPIALLLSLRYATLLYATLFLLHYIPLYYDLIQSCSPECYWESLSPSSMQKLKERTPESE